MSNGLIAFFCAAGAFAWVYSKFYRRTGGNANTSIPAAALVGVIVFLAVLTILWNIN